MSNNNTSEALFSVEMSFLNEEVEEGRCHEIAVGVYDSILRDIAKAQAELSEISGALSNTDFCQATSKVVAAMLKDEVVELKQTKVEGLADDPEMRYYLAVGKLEKQLDEMRQTRDMMEQRKASRAARSAKLDSEIVEQRAAIDKLEYELEASGQASYGVGNVNVDARREMNAKIRLNKILLGEMMGGLKKFIDLTEELHEGHTPHSPYGCLVQALWGNFLKTRGIEYISIQDQDFDVPSRVLNHLVQAGIVKMHPSDGDKVKMEDFTCVD